LKSVFSSPLEALFRRALPALAAMTVLLALAVPVLAQTYDFVGTVVDDVRGEPVGGAEIFTPDGRKLGTSQASGRFEVTVNNRRAKVIFRREGFRELEVNLGDYARLVDVDILMENAVQELDEVTAYAPRRALDPSGAQSIEELESLQGMRMDLNDHLRQMHGVAGMNEFTGDISVYGSRTRDVTHYLGRSRVPSLRHLEFGFPGNQSVLNPRLLKSVTLADNPAKGPVNQGNASALVYDLQEGDPENIRGDVVLGSTNREFNMSTYWDGRTNLFSARYLSPNALGALGRQFYTAPVDSRIPGGCPANTKCSVGDPLRFSALDLFFSTFKRDSSGAFRRHTLIVLEDNYKVLEDKSTTAGSPKAQELVNGFQGAWLYSLESVVPKRSGELEWGFSFLNRNYSDAYRDTTEPINSGVPMPSEDAPRWYPNGGLPSSDVDYLLGDNRRFDRDFILTLQWTSNAQTFGATPSYGLELEHLTQTRHYLDFAPNGSGSRDSSINVESNAADQSVNLANATYRLRWSLGKGRSVEASVGAAIAQQDGTCENCAYVPDSSGGANIPGRPGWIGEDAKKGLLPVGPIASARYTHPLGEDHSIYAEAALRQSTDIEPDGRNRLAARMTPSVEAKLGGNGFIIEPLRYAWSGYARWYDNPALPDPDVYWNYAETREAKSALVKGANLTLNYLPGHHLGTGVNASVIQGEYALRDGGTLPWESNRTLDLVTNVRILPRDDSLLSFIVTYGIQNDAPLYEYRGLWVWTDEPSGQGYATGERAVYRNSSNPSVSRQRLDARINLDLKSRWRPVESMRFFFEATNIFANYDNGVGGWLGGRNERRRGWTRANESGNLEPVVTRGLGLFMMFGIEGKLKI
jgi:hypothetical protein